MSVLLTLICDFEVMNATSPNRSFNRRPLSIMVKGRVESRAIYADLIDISEGGCKVRATSGFANVGDRLTMKVAGIHAPLGKVVWVDDRHAGVAFEGNIHEAVLDHLCERVYNANSIERQRFHRL